MKGAYCRSEGPFRQEENVLCACIGKWLISGNMFCFLAVCKDETMADGFFTTFTRFLSINNVKTVHDLWAEPENKELIWRGTELTNQLTKEDIIGLSLKYRELTTAVEILYKTIREVSAENWQRKEEILEKEEDKKRTELLCIALLASEVLIRVNAHLFGHLKKDKNIPLYQEKCGNIQRLLDKLSTHPNRYPTPLALPSHSSSFLLDPIPNYSSVQWLLDNTVLLNNIRLFLVRFKRFLESLLPYLDVACGLAKFLDRTGVKMIFAVQSWAFYIPRATNSLYKIIDWRRALPYWTTLCVGWALYWFPMMNDWPWLAGGAVGFAFLILHMKGLLLQMTGVGMWVTEILYAYDVVMATIRAMVQLHLFFKLETYFAPEAEILPVEEKKHPLLKLITSIWGSVRILLEAFFSFIPKKYLKNTQPTQLNSLQNCYFHNIIQRSNYEIKPNMLSVFVAGGLFLFYTFCMTMFVIQPIIGILASLSAVVLTAAALFYSRKLAKQSPGTDLHTIKHFFAHERPLAPREGKGLRDYLPPVEVMA